MRILLRSVGKGFYQAPGQWTPDRAQARAFPHVAEAVLEAIDQGLDEAEVYLAFEDPRYDLAVPTGAPPKKC